MGALSESVWSAQAARQLGCSHVLMDSILVDVIMFMCVRRFIHDWMNVTWSIQSSSDVLRIPVAMASIVI
eukprot:scaffold52473_cov17-Prasinocladus_malaysianus.AAC.1